MQYNQQQTCCSVFVTWFAFQVRYPHSSETQKIDEQLLETITIVLAPEVFAIMMTQIPNLSSLVCKQQLDDQYTQEILQELQQDWLMNRPLHRT